tara:strand:- start:367 stop:504 length:138 start_codon:yes stop_codon:yes gene_type:complete
VGYFDKLRTGEKTLEESLNSSAEQGRSMVAEPVAEYEKALTKNLS